jgi:NH3-dependent NAD+ synthetase
MGDSECIVLYSGGTDSTCVAALCAEEFNRVHLLTFHERATQNSPFPKENADRLRKKFGAQKFIHKSISTDKLVQRISYENYLLNLWRHGFFLLCSPGFSSLSWHLRTIIYCQEHGIRHVFDGMTQELLHFPGHMTRVREIFKNLYKEFGISFDSKVIDWPVPPDQRFTDRLSTGTDLPRAQKS